MKKFQSARFTIRKDERYSMRLGPVSVRESKEPIPTIAEHNNVIKYLFPVFSGHYKQNYCQLVTFTTAVMKSQVPPPVSLDACKTSIVGLCFYKQNIYHSDSRFRLH